MLSSERTGVDSPVVDHGTDDPAQHRVRTVLGAYLALTKPRVIELLLVATIPVMLQAHRGTVDIGLIAATLIGDWSLETGEPVDEDDEIKGYQSGPDQYVPLEEDEIAAMTERYGL